MTLEIILPPAPRACDRNHGKFGILAAGAIKRARLIARVKMRGEMERAGLVRGGFTPQYMHLATYDKTGRMDVDNCVATYKHYQDGLFDALGVNDKSIACVHAVRVIVNKGAQRNAHRWTRCVLTDDYHEFRRVSAENDLGFLCDVLEEAKGDAR